jgi:hypothetical protein
MVRRGLTLRSEEGGHYWIVLNDPALTGGEVLLVNFTSHREHRDDDSVPIFGPSDYRRLPHDSVVLFEKAKSFTVAQIEGAIQHGLFSLAPGVPAATLERIVASGKNSRQLSPAHKALL